MQVLNLIGDVKGKVAIMLDDMIDTAGELLLRRKVIATLLTAFNRFDIWNTFLISWHNQISGETATFIFSNK